METRHDNIEVKLEATDTLRFNANKPQLYRDSWRGVNRICRYRGMCILCWRRTYGFDDGEDDRREPLGDHSAQPLDPNDYDCTGDEVPCCFPCRNDTEERYNLALRRARRRGHWVEKTPALAATEGGGA